MKIGKICKAYIVIGMAFAAYGLTEFKKDLPDKYSALTLKQKIKVFIGLTLLWPDPVANGFIKAMERYKEKQNKENGNESES